jgi:hypothetical protein
MKRIKLNILFPVISTGQIKQQRGPRELRIENKILNNSPNG